MFTGLTITSNEDIEFLTSCEPQGATMKPRSGVFVPLFVAVFVCSIVFIHSSQGLSEDETGGKFSDMLDGYYRTNAETRFESGPANIILGVTLTESGEQGRVEVDAHVLQVILSGKHVDADIISQIPGVEFYADRVGNQLVASEVTVTFTAVIDEKNDERITVTLTGEMTAHINPNVKRNIHGIFSGTMTVVWDDRTEVDSVSGSFNAWKLK
jgi:hypothetical protein